MTFPNEAARKILSQEEINSIMWTMALNYLGLIKPPTPWSQVQKELGLA